MKLHEITEEQRAAIVQLAGAILMLEGGHIESPVTIAECEKILKKQWPVIDKAKP